MDSYIAELKALIRECGNEDAMQQILLTDQFIFDVTVREIQEHLLNEMEDEHDLNHCLQEARKIESRITQHNLLGLSLAYMIVNTVDPIIPVGNALLMANHVNYVIKRTILPKSFILQKAIVMAQDPSINHSNIMKSTWTRSPVMTMAK